MSFPSVFLESFWAFLWGVLELNTAHANKQVLQHFAIPPALGLLNILFITPEARKMAFKQYESEMILNQE